MFLPEITEGIIVDDFDSRKEGLWLQERSSPYPEMKEIKEPLAFAHGDVDFSHVLGEFFYENRPLEYSFYLIEKNKEARYTYEIKLQNWLKSKGFVRIYDTAKHGYYYVGKCVSVNVTDDHEFKRLLVTISFDVYPFMISELPEGHDIWDEFNFELDVAQRTNFTMDGEYTFKGLPIGSTATIGAWATTYASGGGKIPLRNIGYSGTITSMEYVESSRSKRAYKVSGIDGLVVEQDIIQAHIEPLEVLLINPGTPSVAPKVDLTAKATILKDGRSYNFIEGGNYTNSEFRLDSGENRLKIYSFHKNEISFDFYKELI